MEKFIMGNHVEDAMSAKSTKIKTKALRSDQPDIPEGFTGLEWISSKYYLIGNITYNWSELHRQKYEKERYILFERWLNEDKRDTRVSMARIWTDGKIEKEFIRVCTRCDLCRE